jgi:uncharacterized protein (DUF2062 family)
MPLLTTLQQRLKVLLPTPESIRNNRWLRWMGPALQHPHLWRFSRRGIALGLALGIFFGLLIPLAQIPLSAAAAVALRANLPMAVVSTLVTNPVTFGPVYVGAYHLGKFVLGQQTLAGEQPPTLPVQTISGKDGWSRLQAAWRWLTSVGKPLVVGLSLLAVTGAVVTYWLAHWFWIWRVRSQRRRRMRQVPVQDPRS